MIKEILQISLVMIVIFTVSQISKAKEVVLKSMQETPESIVSYTYAEGWWDIALTPNSTVAISEENFTGYTEAGFTLNTQITIDYNLYSSYSYSQCQWDQNIKLLDLSINQLVNQTGSWSSGNTTFAWYDFSPGWGGGTFSLAGSLEMGICPPEMPQSPIVEPIIITIGNAGITKTIYVFNNITTLGNYLYRHMPGHENGTCPTTCGNPPNSRITHTVISPNRFPGERIRNHIPWGPIIGCSPIGTTDFNTTYPWCTDESFN